MSARDLLTERCDRCDVHEDWRHRLYAARLRVDVAAGAVRWEAGRVIDAVVRKGDATYAAEYLATACDEWDKARDAYTRAIREED